MKRLFTWFSRRRFPYEPLITVRISHSRLIHNLQEFIKIAPEGRVAPVLKSNAYGHGLIEIARILEDSRSKIQDPRSLIPFFVVDSYFEALSLRSKGIRTPLLIIGYTRPEIIARARLSHVSFTITSLDTLKHIAGFQSSSMTNWGSRKISIHLKIDTGMRRQGLLPAELPEVAHILDINPSIVLKGICSHFSDADNNDTSFAESQIHSWNTIAEKLQHEYTSIEYVHISNTDGHRFTKEARANVSRLGLGLYGLLDGSTFKPQLDLKPVMTMETIVSGVKKLMRDETTGYGNTFKAEKDLTIATIPVGYYEGIDRRLSNVGSVGVGSENLACPIIGRVSMNITTIDVSHVPSTEIQIGAKVTVISDEASDPNSIVSMANKCGTIAYEIAVHVPAHLRRIIT